MHEGQRQFYDFIVDRLSDDKKEEGTALLKEGFAKQGDGTFDAIYLAEYNKKMLSFLKPECVTEVKAILDQFGSSHTSK